MEVAQTLFLRGSSALYSLLHTVLFGIYAILSEFVIGVLSDLWHSDRRHTRNFVVWVGSGIATILRGIGKGLAKIGKVAYDSLK
ncbi:hypothetical protein Har1129_10015 [Haloarcula sp. CBA1129]|nr:hypothetical protein Har1129_10015 [Haloarcula sp. CBA1129]